MENKHERTCIVCREKNEKTNLFRIAEKGSKYVYDKNQKVQSRGIYICKTHECIKRASKNKKYNLEMEELVKMLNEVKKGSKDYLKILAPMKGSEYLSFGINMVAEDIEKIHFLVIAEDISEKNDRKLITRAKNMKIPYVHSGTKSQLGNIFSKAEVTVVGVKNKKVARGLTK